MNQPCVCRPLCSKACDLEEELKNVTNSLKSLEAKSEKVRAPCGWCLSNWMTGKQEICVDDASYFQGIFRNSDPTFFFPSVYSFKITLCQDIVSLATNCEVNPLVYQEDAFADSASLFSPLAAGQKQCIVKMHWCRIVIWQPDWQILRQSFPSAQHKHIQRYIQRTRLGSRPLYPVISASSLARWTIILVREGWKPLHLSIISCLLRCNCVPPKAPIKTQPLILSSGCLN